MPGVFQVYSHELNAYASKWDLSMPHFLGIYEAAPGFTNGIHRPADAFQRRASVGECAR